MCIQPLARRGKRGYNRSIPRGKEDTNMSFFDALLLEDVDDLVFMDVWNRSER